MLVERIEALDYHQKFEVELTKLFTAEQIKFTRQDQQQVVTS